MEKNDCAIQNSNETPRLPEGRKQSMCRQKGRCEDILYIIRKTAISWSCYAKQDGLHLEGWHGCELSRNGGELTE
jgi:hypothetical protein